TADSGYLTRRLVDVAQEVIVREEDCGTDRSVPIIVNVEKPDGTVVKHSHVDTALYGRVVAEDIKVDKKVIAKAGDELSDELAAEVIDSGVLTVRVRSVTTCEADVGVCAACNGRSLASGRMVDTDETGDMVEYLVSYRARLSVNTGDKVEVGQQVTEGSVNPHDILRVKGILALQQHLTDEVQAVYRSQGVTIHDKHIELIARQMLR